MCRSERDLWIAGRKSCAQPVEDWILGPSWCFLSWHFAQCTWHSAVYLPRALLYHPVFSFFSALRSVPMEHPKGYPPTAIGCPPTAVGHRPPTAGYSPHMTECLVTHFPISPPFFGIQGRPRAHNTLCTPHRADCTLHARCALSTCHNPHLWHSARCTLRYPPAPTTRCTVHRALCPLYTVRIGLHTALHTAHAGRTAQPAPCASARRIRRTVQAFLGFCGGHVVSQLCSGAEQQIFIFSHAEGAPHQCPWAVEGFTEVALGGRGTGPGPWTQSHPHSPTLVVQWSPRKLNRKASETPQRFTPTNASRHDQRGVAPPPPPLLPAWRPIVGWWSQWSGSGRAGYQKPNTLVSIIVCQHEGRAANTRRSEHLKARPKKVESTEAVEVMVIVQALGDLFGAQALPLMSEVRLLLIESVFSSARVV